MRRTRAYRPRHAMERPDPVTQRPSAALTPSRKRFLLITGVALTGLAAVLLPGTSFAAGSDGVGGRVLTAPQTSLASPITLLGARAMPVTTRMVEVNHAPDTERVVPRPSLVASIASTTLARGTREVRQGMNSLALRMAPQDTAIPASAMSAYKVAAATLATTNTGCYLPWWVLAGVGRIESGHAAAGRVDASGTTLGPILSAAPDSTEPGSVVPDTDGGKYDHSARFDRAVGAMQIMPSVWEAYGRDGNGDGIADPDNVYDSATTVGSLMCTVGGDLRQPADLARALLNLDPSTAYLQSVVSWGIAYRDGATVVDNATGLVPTTPQEQPLTVIPLVSAETGEPTLPATDRDVTLQPQPTPTDGPTLPVEPVLPVPSDTATTPAPAPAPVEPQPEPTSTPPTSTPSSPVEQPAPPAPEPTQPPATQEPAPPATQDTPPPASTEPAQAPAPTPTDTTTQGAAAAPAAAAAAPQSAAGTSAASPAAAPAATVDAAP